MNSKRISLLLALLVSAILANNLAHFPSLNNLIVSFKLGSKLELSLCNPTHSLIAFYDDGLSSIEVIYKTSLSPDEQIVDLATVNRSETFVPLSTDKYIFPKQCLYKEIDILSSIKRLQEELEQESLFSFKKPHIQSVKFRLTLSKKLATWHLPTGGAPFESEWFHL